MNDDDVREMFRRREGDVHAPLPPSPPLVRRTHRRQLGLVAMTVVSVVTLVVVSILGISAVRSPSPILPAPSPPRERTRTIAVGYFRITFPAGWVLLASPGDGPSANSIQLTNFDPGSSDTAPCSAGSAPFPADGVMLTLKLDADPASPPWPQQLEPVTGQAVCGDTQLAASWIDPLIPIPMTAEATIGSEATDESALREAFDSLSFVADQDQINIAQQGPGPTFILAGGESSSKPWTLGLSNDPSNGWMFELQTPGQGTGAGNVEIPLPSDMVANPTVLFGNEIVFGAVDPSVARVQIRPEGREPLDAELLNPPASFEAPFTPFVAQLPGAPKGTIVLYDSAGATVATYRMSPEGYFSSRYPRSGDPHGYVPGESLAGGNDNHPWKLTVTATGVALFDEAGQEVASTSPLGESGITFASGTVNDTTWVFGIVDPGVTLVQLYMGRDPADRTSAITTPLADGTSAFQTGWAGGSDPSKGVLVAMDGNCEVVASIDIQTGESVAPPKGTPCDAPSDASP